MISSIILILFFTLATVSASDMNETGTVGDFPTEETLQSEAVSENLAVDNSSVVDGENDTQEVRTSIKSDDKNVVKGKYFTVRLQDENGTALSNKTVQFTLNKVKSTAKTDSDGIAKLKVNLNAGKYSVSYSFKQDGKYLSSSGKSSIFVITTSSSKVSAPSFVAYEGIKNKYVATLKVGSTPLEARKIVFTLNGKKYTKTTNSKGEATLSINLKKGTYTLSYLYAGEDKIKKAQGSAKITVKKGAPTKISKANSIIYRHKTSAPLKIKLVDAKGNVVKKAKVTFKINKKSYTKRTNSKGIATLNIKLKTGSYKVKVYFKKTSIYKKSSKTISVKVKPKQARNNGMWLFGADMKSVDLAKLQKYGFKHVFLNFKALELYGKSGVEKWIKNAKSHGIKVHLWMQVFYKGGKWFNPVKGGKINYDLINSKVKEAKGYAKIKGISGIHMDYVRYPGNAYEYKNSVNAVNTFIKKAATGIHKISKKLIVSAAVMPEPSSMKKYYAQDIPTMGKYLDAIVPMVYKGNYNAGTKWIKFVTKTFAKQSKKAKIWTGLQSYKSDSKLNKLSAKELMGDADAAALAGAYGIILFRYGLFNYINFNNV